jgi:hypothetical protein
MFVIIINTLLLCTDGLIINNNHINNTMFLCTLIFYIEFYLKI